MFENFVESKDSIHRTMSLQDFDSTGLIRVPLLKWDKKFGEVLYVRQGGRLGPNMATRRAD